MENHPIRHNSPDHSPYRRPNQKPKLDHEAVRLFAPIDIHLPARLMPRITTQSDTRRSEVKRNLSPKSKMQYKPKTGNDDVSPKEESFSPLGLTKSEQLLCDEASCVTSATVKSTVISTEGPISNEESADTSFSVQLFEESIDNHSDQSIPSACEEDRQSNFDPGDAVKFQRLVIHVVEELQMRRAMDTENENRVRQLIIEKQDADNKLQDVNSQLSNLDNLMMEKVIQATKENQSTIQNLKDEKAKLYATNGASEREVQALKDEIRTLQLTNYNQERKIRELERRVELSSFTDDSSMTHIPEIEEKCAATTTRAEHLINACLRLNRKVDAAIQMNKNLMHEHKHKACEVNRYHAEVRRLTSLLMEAKTDVAHKPEQLKHCINNFETKVLKLARQYQKEKETATHIRNQLAERTSEQQRLNNSITELHGIIATQVSQAKHKSTELAELMNVFKALEEAHKELKAVHEQSEESIQRLKANHMVECTGLKSLLDKSERALFELKKTHEKLGKHSGELEELNTSWSQNNVALHQQISGLKAQIAVPSRDVACQICVQSIETGTQITTEVSNATVQTMCICLLRSDGEAQTLYQSTVCTEVQTMDSITECKAAQTAIEDATTQTIEPVGNIKSSQLSEAIVTAQEDVGPIEGSEVLGTLHLPDTPEAPHCPSIEIPQNLKSPNRRKLSTDLTVQCSPKRDDYSLYNKFSSTLRSNGPPKHMSKEVKPTKDSRLPKKCSALKFNSDDSLTTKEDKSPAQSPPDTSETTTTKSAMRCSFQFLDLPDLHKPVSKYTPGDCTHKYSTSDDVIVGQHTASNSSIGSKRPASSDYSFHGRIPELGATFGRASLIPKRLTAPESHVKKGVATRSPQIPDSSVLLDELTQTYRDCEEASEELSDMITQTRTQLQMVDTDVDTVNESMSAINDKLTKIGMKPSKLKRPKKLRFEAFADIGVAGINNESDSENDNDGMSTEVDPLLMSSYKAKENK